MVPFLIGGRGIFPCPWGVPRERNFPILDPRTADARRSKVIQDITGVVMSVLMVSLISYGSACLAVSLPLRMLSEMPQNEYSLAPIYVLSGVDSSMHRALIGTECSAVSQPLSSYTHPV